LNVVIGGGDPFGHAIPGEFGGTAEGSGGEIDLTPCPLSRARSAPGRGGALA